MGACTVCRNFYFPGSQEFFVDRYFKKGFNPANIKYLGENFVRNFQDLILPPFNSGYYSAGTLAREMTGLEIIKFFGEHVLVPLPVLWHLLSSQEEVLLKSGRTTIIIPPGSKYSIGTFFYGGGWSIRAYHLRSKEKIRTWYKGNQILFRNI